MGHVKGLASVRPPVASGLNKTLILVERGHEPSHEGVDGDRQTDNLGDTSISSPLHHLAGPLDSDGDDGHGHGWRGFVPADEFCHPQMILMRFIGLAEQEADIRPILHLQDHGFGVGQVFGRPDRGHEEHIVDNSPQARSSADDHSGHRPR